MATIQLGVINDIGIIRIAPFTAVELKCLASAVNADNSAALADAATESANAAAATALSYVGTSPTGAYANLAALQAAYPTGEDGVFVVKDTGYWYFWNGSAWEDGGEYQKDIPTTTIEELRMSDLRQMSAIKEVENTLNSININQETTNTASGYGTISLPKNSANGGMQVKLEGLTAENLIVNGDFNSSEGWTTTPQANIVNGELVHTSLAGFGWSQNFDTSIGDKIYYGGIVYSLTANPANDAFDTPFIYFNGTDKLSNQTSTPLRLSAIGTATKLSTKITFNSWFAGNVNHHFDKIFAINLTETFGAGNEPTKEQCDLMFSDYFEGVKSFVPSGRVRSVDKNGINPTALYLTAPELRSNGTVKDEIRKGANGYELVKRVGVGTLGENMLVTFDFNNWEKNNGVLIENSNTFTDTVGGKSISNPIPLIVGKMYMLSVNIQTTSSNVRIFNNTIGNYAPILGNNTIFKATNSSIGFHATGVGTTTIPFIELREVTSLDVVKKGSTYTKYGDNVYFTLDTPQIIPISYGGVLNSAENGTVYHEPVIADAGVYGTNMPILLTDYPIATLEEIIKHENGVDTYLEVSTAVIAPDGLSFTHPDLASGDLVLFTYAFDKESTNGQLTATFYDSNVVKIDTVTGKAYKIEDVVTDGVLTRTLTEV